MKCLYPGCKLDGHFSPREDWPLCKEHYALYMFIYNLFFSTTPPHDDTHDANHMNASDEDDTDNTPGHGEYIEIETLNPHTGETNEPKHSNYKTYYKEE